MDPVTYFNFELSQIKHTSIRELVERIFREKVPKYFMEVEASSSGLYHKDPNGQVVKLCEHVKAAARFYLILMTNPLFRCQFDDLQTDYMLAAILLHDCTKRGLEDTPTNSTVFEHPITSALLLPNPCDPVEYNQFSQICRLITTHHGPWRVSNYSSVQLPEVQDNMQYYVHLCDFMASRSVMWISLSDDSSTTRRFSQ